MSFFTASAEQKNEYAAYQLGRLYLSGENITRNPAEAIGWLTMSSDLGNAYAQYALAKLYLAGEDVQKTSPKQFCCSPYRQRRKMNLRHTSSESSIWGARMCQRM